MSTTVVSQASKYRLPLGIFSALVFIVTSGCETLEKVKPESPCYVTTPLSVRIELAQKGLNQTYLNGPALSLSEYNKMRELADCFGAGALGYGDGCWRERQEAGESGLYARDRMRSAEYIIPERMMLSSRRTNKSLRINDLVVAHATVWETRGAFAEAEARGEITENVLSEVFSGLSAVESAVSDAIVCEALRP